MRNIIFAFLLLLSACGKKDKENLAMATPYGPCGYAAINEFYYIVDNTPNLTQYKVETIQYNTEKKYNCYFIN